LPIAAEVEITEMLERVERVAAAEAEAPLAPVRIDGALALFGLLLEIGRAFARSTVRGSAGWSRELRATLATT